MVLQIAVLLALTRCNVNFEGKNHSAHEDLIATLITLTSPCLAHEGIPNFGLAIISKHKKISQAKKERGLAGEASTILSFRTK